MKIDVCFDLFEYLFKRADRMGNFNNNSNNLKALFDVLEEIEVFSGVEISLNVAEICMEWECLALEDINDYYDQEFDDIYEALEYLQNEGKYAVLCIETLHIICRK